MFKSILKVIIGNPLMRALLTNETALTIVLGLVFWFISIVPIYAMPSSPSLGYVVYGVSLLIAGLVLVAARNFVRGKEDHHALLSGFRLGFGTTIVRIPLDALLSFSICKLSIPMLTQDVREELFLALCVIYFMQLVIPWYLGSRQAGYVAPSEQL